MKCPGESLRLTFDDVTSGEKTPLGRILRNLRLRMRTPPPREPPFRSHDRKPWQLYYYYIPVAHAHAITSGHVMVKIQSLHTNN